jgi:hypothetical protein
MNTRKLLTIWGLAVLAVQAHADNPAMQGVFVNHNQSDVPIKAAIESATQEFNFVTRPIARSRLKKHSPAITRVEITQDTVISIKLGNTKPSHNIPGQPSVKWSRDDGEVFDVAMEWHGATLVHTFVSEEGKRVNRYSLSPDGQQLMMDVTLTGPQLKRAVKYMLTYAREPAQ